MTANDFSAEFAKAQATQAGLLTRIEKATVDLGLHFSQARNDAANGLVGGINPYSIFKDDSKSPPLETFKGNAIELPNQLNLIYHKIYFLAELQDIGLSGASVRGAISFFNGSNEVFSLPVRVQTANIAVPKWGVDVAPLAANAGDGLLVKFNAALVPTSRTVAPFNVNASCNKIVFRIDELKYDGGDPCFFYLGVKSSMLPI